MTSVAVTKNNVNVIITEADDNSIVVSPSTIGTVSIIDTGPQGPPGDVAYGALIVDQTAKVNRSVVYYDANTLQFKADANWTTDTLTDGGNF